MKRRNGITMQGTHTMAGTQIMVKFCKVSLLASPLLGYMICTTFLQIKLIELQALASYFIWWYSYSE
jgi:hypothetical protein